MAGLAQAFSLFHSHSTNKLTINDSSTKMDRTKYEKPIKQETHKWTPAKYNCGKYAVYLIHDSRYFLCMLQDNDSQNANFSTDHSDFTTRSIEDRKAMGKRAIIHIHKKTQPLDVKSCFRKFIATPINHNIQYFTWNYIFLFAFFKLNLPIYSLTSSKFKTFNWFCSLFFCTMYKHAFPFFFHKPNGKQRWFSLSN